MVVVSVVCGVVKDVGIFIGVVEMKSCVTVDTAVLGGVVTDAV